MQAKIAFAVLFLLTTGLMGFAWASCMSDKLTPSEAVATAEIVTATAEVRLANIQATLEDRQAKKNFAATRRANATPTRAPAKTNPTQSQVARWTREIFEIGDWFTVNVEATKLCILLGDIDWDDYDHRITNLSRDFDSMARDMADGSLDSYSAAEIERVISDGNRLIREIGRKCDIPVN